MNLYEKYFILKSFHKKNYIKYKLYNKAFKIVHTGYITSFKYTSYTENFR